MAYPDVDATAHEHRPAAAVLETLGGLGIFAVLGVAVLGSAAGGPEWLVAWVVTAVLLMVTGGAIIVRFIGSGKSQYRSDLDRYRIIVLLALLVGLLGVVYQSRSPGYGVGFDRTVSATLVFLALAAVCILAGNPREYSLLQWVVIGCVLTVVGIFFYHSLSVAAVSVRSRHPIWGGFVMAIGLVVLPQYISRSAFLWAVNRVSAMLVVLALPAYVVGEYTLFGLSFGLHYELAIPLVDRQFRSLRSLFYVSNAFTTIVLPGFVAAIVEFHYSYRRNQSLSSIAIPALLLVVNGIGLPLSFGKALIVISPMVIGIYLAYVVFGRSGVPIAIFLGFGYLASGIAAVHSGFIPLPEGTGDRSRVWYPAIRAVFDQPSLLGAGLVDPGQFIEPYRTTDSTASPHNSYLTMAVRGGIIGGAVYLSLILSSLARSVLRDSDSIVGVSILAMAVGFTAHQLFEAYTLFNWGSSAVLAVFVFGFLAFGGAISRVEIYGKG